MSDFADEVKLKQTRAGRLVYLTLGHACLVIGVIGIFLPVLPTVPFILLASVCYARGSARFYAWLMNHRFFGPPLRDWKATRALPLRAKFFAVGMIALSAGGSIVFLIPIAAVKWLVGVTCACVAGYLIFVIPTRKA